MGKTKHYFFSKVIFIVAGLFVLASPLMAAADRNYEVGVGFMAFEYNEYDDNNVFLDGESGLIPGIIVKMNHKKERSYAEWVVSLYYNKINYDGQTQESGTPVKTKSDALIFDTHFKLGRNFGIGSGRTHSLYTGLGYRYWYRNILPSVINSPGSADHGAGVAGLLEEYYWYYGLLGYTMNFKASENIRVGFDIRLTRMFNAQMELDHLGYKGRDNLTFDLGNKDGARFAAPVVIKMTKSSLTVTPYYEIIDIGKSNIVRVTQGGVATNFIAWEPRSETRNLGVEIMWVW